jgi:hypothetical protein
MNPLMRQQASSQQTPPACDSIAACNALFSGETTRAKLRNIFDALPDKSRGLVLIAGGLSVKDYRRKFDSFDNMERQKIRAGMQYLKQMTVSFDNALGDVRRLKRAPFHRP